MEPAMKGTMGMVGVPISIVVISIIVLALVGTIVFLIIRNNKMKKNILKDRLVKGEISQEEYTKLVKMLKST